MKLKLHYLIILFIFMILLSSCEGIDYVSIDSEYVKISFESNGGSLIKDKEIKRNEVLSLNDAPTKNGYSFNSWYIDKECTVRFVNNSIVSHDLVLFAKWSPVKYSITINDGNKTVNSFTLDYGDNLSLLKDNQKIGYTFMGYYYDREFTLPFDREQSISSDIVLYEKWSINQYNVNLYDNDGLIHSLLFNYNETFSDNTLIKDDYLVEGIYYDSSYTKKVKANLVITSDIDLYVKWVPSKYTITIYDNDYLLTSIELDYKSFVEFGMVSKEDYLLDGYYLDKELTTLFDTSTEIAKEYTLYTKWILNKYTVNIYDNDILLSTSNYSYKQVLDYSNIFKEDHLLLGLYYDKDYTLQVIDNLEVSEHLNLFCKFVLSEYNINIYDGDTLLLTKTVKYNDIIKITEDFSKDDYLVEGYYLDKTFRNKFSTNTKATENMDLYIHYVRSHYNVLVYNEDSLLNTYTYPYLDKVVLDNQVLEDYLFDGYYLEKELINKFDYEVLITEDLILYTKWILDKYTVSIKDSDNVLFTSNYHYKDELSLLPLSKEDYIFDGYYYDDLLTDKASNSIIITRDITLYTKWISSNYTISIYDNDLLIDSITCTYKQEFSITSDYKKTYYIIEGYYLDNTFKTSLPTSLKVVQDFSIYINYVPSIYIISIYDNTTLIDSLTVEYNSLVTIPQLSKTDYLLVGIYLDNDFNTLFDKNTKVTSDLVLYTKWVKSNYTISIYDNDLLIDSITCSYKQEFKICSDYKKTDYVIEGYYLDNTFNTLLPTSLEVVQDFSIYIKYVPSTYTISIYDDATLLDSLTVEYNSLVTIPALSKPDYLLDGIYLDNDFNTLFNKNTKVTTDLVLYTKWVKSNYTINVFDDNTIIDTLVFDYKETIDLNGKYFKDDYTIEGLYFDKDYESFIPSNYEVTKDINIYIHYVPSTYTVSIYKDSILLTKLTVEYKSIIDYEPSNNLDYLFYGYYLDEDLTIHFDKNTLITSDITLYTKWVLNKFNITIYDSGTILFEYSVKYNDVLDLTNIVKDDYYLLGVYLDPTFNNPYNPLNEITTDLVLYTKWKDITNLKYIVRYYQENLEDDEYTLINELSDEGRLGTTVTPLVSDIKGFVTPTTNITGVIKLDDSLIIDIYYKRIRSSITYFIGDEICLKSSNIKCGTPITILTKCDNPDIIFSGWYNDIDLSVIPDFSIMPSHDISIYAKYEDIIKGSNGFTYILSKDNKSYIIDSYNGTDTNVIIPSGYNGLPVTSFTSSTFTNNTKITSITMHHTITNVLQDAFRNCPKLEAINMINNTLYQSIDGVLYEVSTSSLYIYPQAKKDATFTVSTLALIIGRRAFYYNPYLTTINITGNVEYISDEAFSNCSSLSSIIIGDKVNRISSSFLYQNDNITSILVSSNNNYYSSIDGILYNKDITTLLYYPQNSLNTKYVIPSTVTKIIHNSINSPKNLEVLLISKNVTDVEYLAILNSDKLTVLVHDISDFTEWNLLGLINVKEILFYDEWISNSLYSEFM